MPAGEEYLLAEQPLGEQMTRLRELLKETTTLWRAAQQALKREAKGLTGHDLEAAADGLARRGGQATQAFDAALAEASAFAAVVQTGQRLRESILREAEDAAQRLEAEKDHLRKEADRQKAELEAFEHRVGQRLDEMTRRLAHLDRPASHPTQGDSAPRPSEAAMWEATRREGEALRQQTLTIGGIVKVPELTDAVRGQVPGLTAVDFHGLLERWQQEDRLTLQLCNDPRLEPRASEGIQSPRGLLFYVRLR